MNNYKVAILTLIISLSACISSIQPFYYEGDIIAYNSAEGIWLNCDTKTEKWIFYQEDSIYKLTIKDKKNSADFNAVFFKIGTQTFIDIAPTMGSSILLKDYLNISTHVVGKVRNTTDSLILDILDSEWLSKAIDNGKVDLHKVSNDAGQEIIIDDTQALQVFLRNFSDSKEAFDGSLKLVKN